MEDPSMRFCGVVGRCGVRQKVRVGVRGSCGLSVYLGGFVRGRFCGFNATRRG